jgi:hypothetical protein
MKYASRVYELLEALCKHLLADSTDVSSCGTKVPACDVHWPH